MDQGLSSLIYSIMILSLGLFLIGLKNFNVDPGWGERSYTVGLISSM